jgi:hypothetical protein
MAIRSATQSSRETIAGLAIQRTKHAGAGIVGRVEEIAQSRAGLQQLAGNIKETQKL